MSYSYNDRLRASMSITQPYSSPWQQIYGYDALRRLTSLTSGAGTFGYVPGGTSSGSPLVKRINFPNGAYMTNDFDSLARLKGTFLRDSADTLLNSHEYLVNAGHQRYKQTFKDDNYVDYIYDDIGQLISAEGTDANGTNRLTEQLLYKYDAAGNLEKRTNLFLRQTFTVNSLNQLSGVTNEGTFVIAGIVTTNATSVVINGGWWADFYADGTWTKRGWGLPNGIATYTAVATDALGRKDTNSITVNYPNAVAFSYDQNGNLISDGRRGFDYDDENQLIRVTVTNEFKSEFIYDGKMRRRVTREYKWQNSAWVQSSETRYVYDGMLHIQERDGNNIPRVTYTRGLDLSGTFQGAGGIGGLLARTDDSLIAAGSPDAHAYYHADGSGNVTMLINENEIPVAKYHYDPFGRTIAQSGPLADANTMRFSSKEYHAPSGLYYYLRRYYDPNLQRWLNHDPLGEAGGINLYAALGNSPINYVDIDGQILHHVAGGLLSVGIGAGIAWISGDCYNAKDALLDFGSGALGTIPFNKLSKVVPKGWNRPNSAFTYGRKKGTELAEESHFIPGRYSNPKSKDYKGIPRWVTENPLNRTRQTGTTHAKSDPFRRDFMPKDWREENPLYDPFGKWWYRTPPWLKSGPLGGIATPASEKAKGECSFWSW